MRLEEVAHEQEQSKIDLQAQRGLVPNFKAGAAEAAAAVRARRERARHGSEVFIAVVVC